MKRIILFFLISTLLLGCTKTQQHEIIPPHTPAQRIMEVPVWFFEPPSGDYMLGMSRLSHLSINMEAAAFENAVVNYCRNRSSFLINKKALRESEILPAGGEAKFQLVVSSHPPMLYETKEKLKKLDHFWFYDMFVGLYGKTRTDTTRLIIVLNEEIDAPNPEWFKNGLRLKDNELFACVRADSHDGILAWNKALDACRLKMAEYIETEVTASIYHINEQEDKLLSLETTRKMGEMQLSRVYMRRYLSSGGPGYCVFLEMRMKL